MNIKVVLMDKDGTLIDFYKVWGKTLNPVMDTLIKKYNLDKIEDIKRIILEFLGVHGDEVDGKGLFACKSFQETAYELCGYLNDFGVNIDSADMSDFFIEEFDREIEKLESIPSFTDTENLVKNIKNKGIHVGVATTDEFILNEKFMEKLGIKDEIEVSSSTGSKLPVKPDTALMDYVADKFGVEKMNIAMVGDTMFDMKFAKDAGAIAIGVLSGTGKRNELEEYADYIIDSVDELEELIDSINEK